jgi:hypothetical protein
MPPPNSSPSKWIQGIVVAVVLGYLVYRQVSSSGAPPASPQPTASPTASPSAPAPARANSPTASPSGAPRTGEDAILDAFKKGRSNLIVEVSAIVKKNLPDDDVGDRHQKFLVKLSGGHTLLVAHNIDLAPRAPVQEGDRVEIKGEYEWSEQGGVLHWTHHDPDQRHQDGHIRLNGKTYK